MRRKLRQYIKLWEGRGYEDEIPDEAPACLEGNGLVPSYRRICIAIMKNDTHLETLGMSRPGCRLYNELKRAELIQKGKIQRDPQLVFAL